MEPVNQVSTPLEVQISNFFQCLIETIKSLFSCLFGEKDRQAEITQCLQEGKRWTQLQEYRIPTSPRLTAVRRAPTDQVTVFFTRFFENLGTSYFKVTVIEQIKKAISHGLSEVARSQADNVVAFFLQDSEELDLDKPWIRELVESIIPHLLSYCPTLQAKRQAILDAIGNENSAAVAIAISQNCNLAEMEKQLGKEHVKPFLKNLSRILGPKVLRSNKFIEAFSGSLYHTIRPLVETSVGEGIKEVSPAVQVTAKIGSMLIGERVAKLFLNLNIKNIFDAAVEKGMRHLVAHRNTYAALPPGSKEDEAAYYLHFATEEGCHPLARRIINASPYENVYPLLMNYFEEVSRSIVNYVFEDQVVNEFVTDLGAYREDLLKDVQDPLIRGVLDAILLPGNREILANSIKALKPLAVKSLAQVLYLVGIKKVFSKKQIFKMIYRYLSPSIADVMQRVMIKKVTYKHINDKPFMEDFANIYDQYRLDRNVDFRNAPIMETIRREYITYVHSSQHIAIKDRIPQLAQEAFKEMMDNLRLKGWRPGGLTTFAEEIKYYTYDVNYSDNSAIYGQLIMMAIFGVAKRGLAFSVARHGFGLHENTKWLTDIFTDIFLNGVYDLRGVDRSGNPIPGLDPNQVFFDIIKDAIKPYEDPENVTSLLQVVEDPWDQMQIDGQTKVEAERFAAILHDLIGVSSIKALATAVDAVVGNGGLPGQLEFALKNLFGKNLVNYSLLFHFLDILNTDIMHAKNPESVK